MQGCGRGRRLSSLSILVSSWRRISSVSAASLSRERFDEVRHVDYRMKPSSARNTIRALEVTTRDPGLPASSRNPSQTGAVASQGPWPGPGERCRRTRGSTSATTVEWSVPSIQPAARGAAAHKVHFGATDAVISSADAAKSTAGSRESEKLADASMHEALLSHQSRNKWNLVHWLPANAVPDYVRTCCGTPGASSAG